MSCVCNEEVLVDRKWKATDIAKELHNKYSKFNCPIIVIKEVKSSEFKVIAVSAECGKHSMMGIFPELFPQVKFSITKQKKKEEQ